MDKKGIKVEFSAPLHVLDTENQTYGCRANNPNICRFCYLDNVCAFVRDDRVCMHPSAVWKKQYKKLRGSV